MTGNQFYQKESLLVIIDMINGFVKEGNLHDTSINEITPTIIELIHQFQSKQLPIINFRDSHSTQSTEFSSFPCHCLCNSVESECIDELKPYEDYFITLLKNSTNGFMQPQFKPLFETMNDLKSVVIVGCCTDICVLQFALSTIAYIHENNRKTDVIVISDAVSTFNGENHDQKQINEMSLTLMRINGIKVMSKKEYDNYE